MAPPLIPNRRYVLPRQEHGPPSRDHQPSSPGIQAADASPQRPDQLGSEASVTASAPRAAPTSTGTLRPASSNTAETTVRAASATTTGSPTTTETPSASPTPTQQADRLGNMSGTQRGIVIAIVAVIAVIIFAFTLYMLLKSLRIRYKDPKYIPTKYLKQKWVNWDVVSYKSTPQQQHTTQQTSINRAARSRANIAANRLLDRQDSIRSVITLPPYRESAEETLERVIGREGERGGLDTVVVYPETQQEEEARREERMQAMYELRLQRRAQRAAREARENGSTASLSTTTTGTGATGAGAGTPESRQGRGASVTSLTAMDMETGGGGRSTSELTAAILNDRTRRTSEVSYSDVGYVRPDGSRIRSTSNNRNTVISNSDSQPLLSDAASAGRRSRSGSVLSINTNISGRPSMERRDSTEILTGGDIGQARLPPSYDGLDWGDAPPYMSPVSPVSRSDSHGPGNRVEQLRGRQPSMREGSEPRREGPGLSVPLVRVIGASNPNSPMSPNHRDGPL